MRDSGNKILVINSAKTELIKVEQFLADVLEEYNLKKSNYNRIVLCVSEAVINSIEHGNKNDINKAVTIEVDCNSQRIYVKIKDEGNGFKLNQVDDPTVEKNIKKESGRGIHIIRSLSDSLIYNNKGNSVQLKIECK